MQSLYTGSVLFWLSNFGQVLSHIVATWSQHSQLFLASFYHQLFFDFPVSRNIVTTLSHFSQTAVKLGVPILLGPTAGISLFNISTKMLATTNEQQATD